MVTGYVEKVRVVVPMFCISKGSWIMTVSITHMLRLQRYTFSCRNKLEKFPISLYSTFIHGIDDDGDDSDGDSVARMQENNFTHRDFII